MSKILQKYIRRRNSFNSPNILGFLSYPLLPIRCAAELLRTSYVVLRAKFVPNQAVAFPDLTRTDTDTGMSKPWKILEEHYYERFKIFSAKRSRRENPRTGVPFDFFLMEGVDWTNVIALTKQQEIVLVRQYRHGADKPTLELPGGTVEPGEDPLDAARRELLEETGFHVPELRSLGSLYANPAMQSMQLHLFVGEIANAIPDTQQLDPGEDIQIVVKPLTEFLTDVREGRAEHALTAAAIGLFLLDRQQQ